MHSNLPVIGWREWIDLKLVDLPHVKAKIDTGARTSCLHAFEISAFKRKGERWVRFKVHPNQFDLETVVACECPVVDRRWVSDSGGHRTRRYVIRTEMTLGDQSWPIELTLQNRDNMRFRMLLGRTALSGRFLVDTSKSFCFGGTDEVPPGMPSDEEEE